MKRLGFLFITAVLFCSVVMTVSSCKKDEKVPTYIVDFDSKGGTPTPQQKVKEGDIATKPEDPTREGYSFAGWATADNETGALWNFETEIVTEDMTLYARWKINTYTVTFDSDGGSAVPAQNISHGNTATKPADPTRNGYKFDGWFNGNTEWNFATPVTAPVTLKAKWTAAYLITFNSSDGATAVEPQNIPHGSPIPKPANPTRAFPATAELLAGPIDVNTLPTHYTFVEWRKAGETTAFDFNAPITGPVNLQAVWSYSGPTLIDISAQSGVNRVEQAFSYANANADPGKEFTLLVGANVEIAPQKLDAFNAKLTIIGMGGRREISFRSSGNNITIGAQYRTGISFTIGSNITLKCNYNAVYVTRGAEFVMLDGSEISGNTSTSSYYWSPAVNLDYESTFTMKGGEIKNNSNPSPNVTVIRGVSITGGSSFNMEGGKIINNSVDIYVESTSSFALSGNAEANYVNLNADAANNASIFISQGWTGKFDMLNFTGGGLWDSMATLISWWVGKPVLTGAGVNAAAVAKMPLGYFIRYNRETQAITLHEINSSGVFVTK